MPSAHRPGPRSARARRSPKAAQRSGRQPRGHVLLWAKRGGDTIGMTRDIAHLGAWGRLAVGAGVLLVALVGCVLDLRGKDRCEGEGDCISGYDCVQGHCEWPRGDGALCDNTCDTARDGACDDGGAGATFDLCTLGTDCADCGARDVAGDGDGDGDGDCESDCAAEGYACNEDVCMAQSKFEDDLYVCADASPACPGDQVCVLGLCAPPCDDDTDCLIGMQCDEYNTDRCLYDDVNECMDAGDCDPSQNCVAGLCVGTVTPLACTLYRLDDCGPRELCLDVDDGPNVTTACVEIPACDQFNQCADGGQGSVCNIDDRAPDKQRICLVGRCVGSSDCPVNPFGWECLQPGGSDELGWCTDFAVGAPCTAETADACPGAVCDITDGVVGVCT